VRNPIAFDNAYNVMLERRVRLGLLRWTVWTTCRRLHVAHTAHRTTTTEVGPFSIVKWSPFQLTETRVHKLIAS